MQAEVRHSSIEPKTQEQQIAEVRDEIHEIREMLVTLLTRQGYRWEDMPPRPNLFAGHEDRIPLEEAVRIFWGKSAAKDPESLSIHADFLRHWATTGLNGVLLEKELVAGKWYTSREAVRRFQEKLRMKRG